MNIKYPETFYVMRENEGTEDEYFSVNEKPSELAELGERKIVGVYGLLKTVAIETEISVKSL
jgi:hypothetical protein